MRPILITILLSFLSLFSLGTDKDSLNIYDNPHYKREDAFSIIQKMNNEQLLRLIDYMFEAKYIPDDLWKEVNMEIEKRNLININKNKIQKFSSDIFCSPVRLLVGKMVPDTISHISFEFSQQ